MAKPQLEDGYIRLARELCTALTKIPITGAEFRVCLAVIGKTYGWNKKEDHISIGQLMELTGLGRSGVCKATASLVHSRILGRKTNGITSVTTYWIIKDYDKWNIPASPLLETSPLLWTSPLLETSTSPQSGLQLVHNSGPTINNTKETLKTCPSNGPKKRSIDPPALREVFEYFCITGKKEYKLTPERAQIISQRLKQGYTVEQMKTAIDNFCADTWEDRQKYFDIAYCLGTRNKINLLDKWLNTNKQQEWGV